MKTKIATIVSLLVLLTLVLTACAKPAPVVVPEATADDVVVEPAATEPAEPTARDLQNGKPFIYTGNLYSHPVIKMMMLGWYDACRDYDVECKFIVAPGADEASLVDSINQAIAYGASGILASSYEQYRETVLNVYRAGIPVIGQHGDLSDIPEADKNEETTGLIGWVGPQAKLYGAQVAEALQAKDGCVSPVIVTQSSINTTEDAANAGFHDKWAELCPESEILETQLEGLEPVEAIAKVSAVLLANPDLKAAFGTTGGSINAWGKAMQQAGFEMGQVTVFGMDATSENIDMVRSGWVYAIVNQPIYEENYRAVELLIAHLKGEAIPFDNPMPSSIVTVDGLDALEELAKRSLTDLPED